MVVDISRSGTDIKLEFDSAIDGDVELKMVVEVDFHATETYLSKESAISIVNHLVESFGLKTVTKLG